MRSSYTALVVILLQPHGALASQRIQHLQRIRHTHDAAYARWLPHMTLIPPFVVERERGAPGSAESKGAGSPPRSHSAHRSDASGRYAPPAWLTETLDGITTAVRAACTTSEPAVVHLTDIGAFRLRNYENIHLRPSRTSARPLLSLQRAIHAAVSPLLPRAPTRRRQRDRFVPHASLGQAPTPEDRADIVHDARVWLHCDGEGRGAADERRAPAGIDVCLSAVQVMYKPSHERGPYTVWADVPVGR
ncbi:hypothetical protein MSPP1_004138 [Malassezia sp. CBS 17886]|nr:hypothetical protein MSPP1_004138 [Malassezia sp. CBS 17886]